MKKTVSVFLLLIITLTSLVSIGSAALRRGDTNGDGEVDNKDVVTLFRYVSGNDTGAVPDNCDFNCDGATDNKDVVALFRAVSSGEIPPEEEQKKETVFIDFGSVPDGFTDFLTKQSYCVSDMTEDPDEGKVLRITTESIISTSAKPVLFFKYADYSASIGEKPASFVEKPFLVLKVKVQIAHDRMFSVTGTESDKSYRSTNEASAKIPGGDGWHYICLDFTEAKTPDKFNSLRICFEQFAGKDGEEILISEMRICTAEEAAEYEQTDVYTVEEQTMDDYNIKVMQFNIQTENGNGAPIVTRSELFRRLVDELQPDVIGMQEVTVTWRKWLDSYVFNDSYAGVGEARTTDASKGIEANPIYYRKDKFDLIEYGTFWLSDTPEVEGSMYEDSSYPRICTWVHLRDKSTGVEFVHINTHLDNNGDHKDTGNDRRKRQIGVIIKFAQRFDDSMPMFLTGDLNNRRTTSEGKTYALIKMIQGDSQYTDADGKKYSIALSDTRLTAPGVDTVNIATMTKYYDETNSAYNPSYEPIDYIFYSGANMSALSYQTFLITEYGAWISDHLPLYATFKLTPPPPEE